MKHIRTPDIDLAHLFMRIRRDVVTATSRKQVPWESSSLIGDFYFNPQRGISVTSKPPATGIKKNSSLKADSLVIAKIPPSPKVNIATQARSKRVAILPFVFDFGGRYLKERILTSTIDAFHSRDFSIDWSYYKLRRFRSIKKIDEDMFSSFKIDQIWDKKSVLLKSQLDVEMVSKIGRSLDADIVVVGITEIETGDGQWLKGLIKLYIIDVVNQKIYSKKVTPSNRSIYSPEFMSNYENALKLYIDNIFS
ncbi:MAG: caspase family protein [Desulfobacterales bacterium]|nr:caspase family protein [Desulfobacterales bacterium]